MVSEKTNKSAEDPDQVVRCDTCGQVVDTEMFEKEGELFDGRCFYCLAEEDCSCSD
jgi:hypothetical protein